MKVLLILVCALVHTNNAVEWMKGRGAQVAFVEVEAEHAKHTGTLIGNDRTYGTLSSEASERRAVTLNKVGQYVEFTLPIEANSIVIRYSIPDSADGKGRDAAIDLYVNGKHQTLMTFTSKYSWLYGQYPFNNNPGSGNAHHFYDSYRTLLDKTYPKGTKVKVQVSSTAQSPSFTIDLADFELVGPPKPKPDGALSVLDYQADPHGRTDSTKQIQKAVDDAQAQKKALYIPAGSYVLYDHVIVHNDIELVGAGPWYTILGGRDPSQRQKSAGIFGHYGADDGGSKNVILRDFAIIGDIQERDDSAPTNAIGGSLSNSVIDNLWLQHTKCGVWVDGPMTNLSIINSRIMDTMADGVNFYKGVTHSKVENTFLRNTGDDGLAMWGKEIINSNNKFVHNTMGIPVLANNIAIYGGREMDVSDNLLYDTISNGGGIHISNRYAGVNGDKAVSGRFDVERNTLVRCGNSDYNWHFGIGAVWFSGLNQEITNAKITVKDTDIIDSSYEAIQYIEGKVQGVTFENVLINGTGTYVLQFQKSGGDITFKNLTVINVGTTPPIYKQADAPVKIIVESGSKANWYTDKPDSSETVLKAKKPKWPGY